MKAVPAQADELAVIAAGADIIYRGGSLASFGEAIRATCIKRTNVTPAEKQIVLERQNHQCAICHQADVPFEFDQVIPVCAGGENHVDNIQALCIADHQAKSEQERQAHDSAWYSHFNRNTLEGRVDAPIPRQVVIGDGQPCIELDVVACRRWAIKKADYMPCADFLDLIEVFHPAQLAPADFIFIDAGPPDTQHYRNYAAYSGPRWHGRELARFIQ